jgi:hypothetical protein
MMVTFKAKKVNKIIKIQDQVGPQKSHFAKSLENFAMVLPNCLQIRLHVGFFWPLFSEIGQFK